MWTLEEIETAWCLRQKENPSDSELVRWADQPRHLKQCHDEVLSALLQLSGDKQRAEAKIKQLEAALDQARRDGDRVLERLAKAVYEREEALNHQAAAVGRYESAIEERNIALVRIDVYEKSGYLPQFVKDKAIEKINKRGKHV